MPRLEEIVDTNRRQRAAVFNALRDAQDNLASVQGRLGYTALSAPPPHASRSEADTGRAPMSQPG
jgi:hypothetical protein